MGELENVVSAQNESDDKLYFPRRYIVAVMCWLGLFILHAMRVNIAITVVTILGNQPDTKVGSDVSRNNLPDVHWNSISVGLLHGIFYVGFITTQIPGGYISRKPFVSKIFSVSIALSSVLNWILPVPIQHGSLVWACVIRLFQGFCEGLVFPSLYSIMHLWFPNKSIHKYGGWIFGGMYAGPIVGFAIDGAIIHFWRWQLLFYLHGLLGVIWFALWFLIIYDSPSTHPTISDVELKYITSHHQDERERIPWRRIFSSLPMWSIIICNFIQSWMFILMITNEPTFLNQFDFTMLENGIYSAIPHVLKVLVAATSGYLSEIILINNWLNRTNVRKLFNSLGFGVEALACYCLVFSSNGIDAVILLSIGIGFSGLTVSGWQINFLDIAPEIAGVLAGVSATFGTCGGILSPIVIGFMTHPQSLKNWQRSFIVTGSVLTLGTTFFAIFASGDNQNWTSEEETQLLEKR